ncbi:hypothetical protein KI387_021847, partial [Taxus chinensis]
MRMRKTRGSAGSGETGERRTNAFGTNGTKMCEVRDSGVSAEIGTKGRLVVVVFGQKVPKYAALTGSAENETGRIFENGTFGAKTREGR